MGIHGTASQDVVGGSGVRGKYEHDKKYSGKYSQEEHLDRTKVWPPKMEEHFVTVLAGA